MLMMMMMMMKTRSATKEPPPLTVQNTNGSRNVDPPIRYIRSGKRSDILSMIVTLTSNSNIQSSFNYYHQ